jgi:hypothetical protein
VNQKTVVGIIVVIVLLMALALPIMYSMKKDAAPQQQASAVPAAVPSPAPVPAPLPAPPMQQLPPPPPQPSASQQPLVWEGTYTPPPKAAAQFEQIQKGKKGAAKANTGPALTAETLVGTVWQVDSPYGPVSVEFGANGQAFAMHSMVGMIPASWSIQGNKVVANASAMGQKITIDATIEGQNLVAQGQAIRRVR